jgi:ATP-dependent exoDNAse (exonuclease V) beta subunit
MHPQVPVNLCACKRIFKDYRCEKMMHRNIFITFTNKAVHEMKSRIVGSLSEFAEDPAQKRRN